MKIQLRKLKTKNSEYVRYSIYGLIKSIDRRKYKTTTAQKVGDIWIIQHDKEFTLSFYIDPRFRRQKYATTAINEILKLHLELEELHIYTDTYEIVLQMFILQNELIKRVNATTWLLFNPNVKSYE